jgi:lipopolysaccharide/colanic/teichoic acid biosynthesis glycosyltransferase
MFYDLAKRFIDIGSSLAVGLIFLPIIILVSVGIKLDSPGPVIFKHRRVGKDGKIFHMWKFRSMISGANDPSFLKNKEFIKRFKKKEGWKLNADEDPRITRVGRFIRKYSLDELPQLWNILMGEMSMVGPRPYRHDSFGNEIEEQLKKFPHLRGEVDMALSVKPGVSGPWQTSGRNELSWDDRVKRDADYARKRSIMNDILIILKTPFSMANKW